MRLLRLPWMLIPTFFVSTVAPGVFAQTSAQDRATAEALFQEAKKLKAAEEYDAACPKFAASQKLDPALGTLLNLADCHEQQGLTASAWAEFLEAATLARRAGQAERAKVAKERATALEGRLTRLKGGGGREGPNRRSRDLSGRHAGVRGGLEHRGSYRSRAPSIDGQGTRKEGMGPRRSKRAAKVGRPSASRFRSWKTRRPKP